MVPSLSRSTSLKTLLMSFSGMGCPSTDWNLVQPAPFTASIMSCKQGALAAYWWAVDNSKYHELRQIQNSVTLGSVLPEKFTNIFVLEWYYVSNFWAVEDSHTAHLVQVTSHAVEEVQNLIDVHLPVCFSVDPLEHLLILILSSTFNLVGHTQNRRHNKYLEPFHCGGILRRKINNIWESKSHSSLIQTKWQTEWFLIGVTVVIRVWHGGSGSDVRRNIHWRLLSRSKLVLNTCQYYTSIVYRFPIVHFNGLNWDKITVILLVLFGYPVIPGIPGILCNYINRYIY